MSTGVTDLGASTVTKDLTDSSAKDEIENAGLPVLVSFWAERCGPWETMATVLEEVADSYTGSLMVCEIDADKNPETPKRYDVHDLPKLLLIKDGQVAASRGGAVTKPEIFDFVNNNL